jgi:excisionase family DNA binding protein
MTTTTIHAAPIAFSVGEVAELLGCSTDTVRRMIGSGRLDAIQPLGKGGRVFVGRSSIERLFDEAGADVFSDTASGASS